MPVSGHDGRFPPRRTPCESLAALSPGPPALSAVPPTSLPRSTGRFFLLRRAPGVKVLYNPRKVFLQMPRGHRSLEGRPVTEGPAWTADGTVKLFDNFHVATLHVSPCGTRWRRKCLITWTQESAKSAWRSGKRNGSCLSSTHPIRRSPAASGLGRRPSGPHGATPQAPAARIFS